MQLRSRYFTYPVIMKETDFYIDSLFETDAEFDMEGYNLKLILSAKLINIELEKMLEDNLISIVHHIECPQTCFRRAIKSGKYKKEVILKDGQVNGIIQICSFLIANKDIEKYSNKLFAKDYRGFKFDLEKGCIMGIGNQVNLRVNKMRDDLAKTTSIFSIFPNIDPLSSEMKVDLSGNKIGIHIPEKNFAVYSNMNMDLGFQSVMHSMIIVPALIYTFYELREAGEQLYSYEDNRWFRGLKKACNSMGIELDEDGLKSMDILSNAQKLLDSPIIKGIDYFKEDGDLDEY